MAALTMGLAALLGIGTVAAGDILFYDLDAGGSGPFYTDIGDADYLPNSETEWEDLDDWSAGKMPVVIIDGPVDCNTNNAVFNPGDIPFNLAFDSNLNQWGNGGPAGRGQGGGGLLAVGPSANYANPENALVSNYLHDSFDVMVTEGPCRAVALYCTNLSGLWIDITVYDVDHNQLGQLSHVACGQEGHNWGILATPDEVDIWRVNVYDDVSNGAEGVMKVMTWVKRRPADVNGDGVVDFNDLAQVLAAWGQCDDCPEDINDDGVVDIDDLFLVLAGWG